MTSAPRAGEISIVLEPERQTLRARGSEAISWLNGLSSIELKAVAPGRGAFGLLLTKTGKIQTDLDVLARPGELVLGVGAGVGDAIRKVLDQHLVMEDVELEAAPELVWLRLLGPGAGALAASTPEAVAHGTIDWLGSAEAVRGAALVVERSAVDQTLRGLLERAPGSRVLEREAWDLLRLRHGFPEFGRDYGSDDNPHEAALDRRAVSWDKGCYLGQEVVCMQDMRGRVKRRLSVLRIDSAQLPAAGVAVAADDKSESVGIVRSAAFEPNGGVLAFARLASPYFDTQSPPALSVLGSPARIVPLP